MTLFREIESWLLYILIIVRPDTTWDIELESMPNNTRFENAAIMSNPNDQAIQLISGRVKHIDYKTFYIRWDFIEKPDRISNEQFFEEFKKLVVKKNISGELPESDTRQWRSIECIGTAYPAVREESSGTAVYQVSLRLVYIEGV
jgi:hypothetical protein